MASIIDVALQKFADVKFSASFSDLMMGAMGTMVVLLSFLTVVTIKGQGSYSATQVVDMPVGLRDHKSMPISRLRVYTCQKLSDATPIQLVLPSGEAGRSVTHSTAKIGSCFYENVLFPQGLGETKTIVKLASDAGAGLNITVHLMIGGYSLPVKTFHVTGRSGQDAIKIDLNNKDIIAEA